ncbi:MAG: zf-HC2 domain-containing protein [Phycisphaerae bacterium]
MNCGTARKWMSPYLDSELESDVTFEVSRHLQSCPHCARRFELEQAADALMRDRLTRETMPKEIWGRIQNELSGPRRVIRLRWFGGPALAAAVLVAALAVWESGVSGPNGSMTTPGLAARLVSLAPDDTGFTSDESAAEPVRLAAQLLLGVSVEFPPAANQSPHQHVIELVSADWRDDSAGRSYLEVRLNCCGKPTLLLLARRVAGELPKVFDGAAPDRDDAGEDGDTGVRWASRQTNGFVAMAASRHPVQPLLKRLKLRPV